MAMRKQKRQRQHTALRPGTLALILLCGQDFFDDLPDGVAANHVMLRAAWLDPEIRTLVYARQAASEPDRVPWALIEFGE